MEDTGLLASLATIISVFFRAVLQVIPVSSSGGEFLLLVRENKSNPLLWALLCRPHLQYVTQRIRKYVLYGDTNEAWRLKESYKDTFALEAVSAAIIAQIAITMLGLDNFGNIHWAATALTYASLISGILSTFFAFYIQQRLGYLHSSEDVRDWLLSRRDNPPSWPFDVLTGVMGIPRSTADNDDNDSNNQIPSVAAAAALTAPSELLSLSIVSLFTALAIYLVSMYTDNLGNLKGHDSNLAVLLFVIIFSALSMVEVLLPLISRPIDRPMSSVMGNSGRGRDSGMLRQDYGLRTSGGSGGTGDVRGDIRDALQASIHA
ncbi:hypothetical protein BDW59DRAFT_147408 [Aspergillus cavernicola]|uniref:Uncharacterized protein n=1 Tax=Aspergillus cavernicola TaxID=176166 RepID=A0ABR4IA02_9EURO